MAIVWYNFRPMRRPQFSVFFILALLVPLSALAGPLQDDLKARRGKAMERLGPDALAIFWSAPERVYSLDVDYEYRQDSTLLYLTGIDQQDTILILMPGNQTRKEVLFIREADARREHWNGHSLTPAEATAQSGIQTVMPVDQFEPFVAAMFSKRPMGASPAEFEAFFSALTANRARLAVVLEPQPTMAAPPGPAPHFA